MLYWAVKVDTIPSQREHHQMTNTDQLGPAAYLEQPLAAMAVITERLSTMHAKLARYGVRFTLAAGQQHHIAITGTPTDYPQRAELVDEIAAALADEYEERDGAYDTGAGRQYMDTAWLIYADQSGGAGAEHQDCCSH